MQRCCIRVMTSKKGGMRDEPWPWRILFPAQEEHLFISVETSNMNPVNCSFNLAGDYHQADTVPMAIEIPVRPPPGTASKSDC